MTNNTISDQTKIHLFVVIGALAVTIPTIISITMWFAELRHDATQAGKTNVEQDQIMKEINDKLSVVYGFDSRLQSIESILKIKKNVSIDIKQDSLKL